LQRNCFSTKRQGQGRLTANLLRCTLRGARGESRDNPAADN
jgi:hypothetical protein